MNLADSLLPWSRYRPAKIALVDVGSDRAFTYLELHQRADRAARWLRDTHGVVPGDRVAVLAWNRVEFIDLYFACARLGPILVPLNWRLAAPELVGILGDCSPRLTLWGEELRPLVDVLSTLLDASVLLAPLGATCPWEGWEQGPLDSVEAGPELPLMLLYTSGSTGRPKGAILTHGTITWNAVNTVAGWELRPDDVALVHSPLFHTGGWGVFLLPLLHQGATCVLTPRFDPASCLGLVESHRITLLFAVPTMWQMLCDTPGWESADLSSVRFAITGGAACPLPLLERWARRGVRFKQGFGLTEVGPNCFVMPDGTEIEAVGSVGFPMPHLDTRRVTEDGAPAAPEAPGELWLRGPTVCAGYWMDPEATTAAMKDGAWFATGDLFTEDPSGHFRFVGRQKEIFVSGGENVSPTEVERVLYDLLGIAEAAVVPVPDPVWGEVGHAFISLRPDAPPGLGVDQVLDHVRASLARYKVPKHITVLPVLPKGPSGKISKRDLLGGPQERS